MKSILHMNSYKFYMVFISAKSNGILSKNVTDAKYQTNWSNMVWSWWNTQGSKHISKLSISSCRWNNGWRSVVNHNSGNKKNTKYVKYKVVKVIKSRWRGSGQLSSGQQGTSLLDLGWAVIGPELVTWPPPSPLIGRELGMTCHRDNSFTYEDTEPCPNTELLLMSADNLCSTNI